MTLVKFCGVTRPVDAEVASSVGCDFIGLNFVPSSPRSVTLNQAASIAQASGSATQMVGVFLDASALLIRDAIKACGLSLLQFHGESEPGYCEQFGLPYISVTRVRDAESAAKISQDHPNAWAVLLDAWVDGSHGGTGMTFDWNLVPTNTGRRIFLAGGLNADNVGEAIARTAPFAVDVASGIESQPGLKDHQAMHRFMEAVTKANRENLN